MNPIEKALATADTIIAHNAELERLSRNPHITVIDRPTPDNSDVVALGVAHQRAVDQAKQEIIADVRNRQVSPNVYSFSDLHNFVDANTYGGLCDDNHFGLEGQAWVEFGNGVQNAVDSWIKQDGVKEALNGAEFITLASQWDREAGEAEAIVFYLDVTDLTDEQRGALVAAVSAQLDDGTEDYPGVEYDHREFNVDSASDLFGAVEVGLGL